MWPHDLSAIFSSLRNLNETFFPPNKKALIYQEVMDFGGGRGITADEYVGLGRVTEFRYGKHLGKYLQLKLGYSEGSVIFK